VLIFKTNLIFLRRNFFLRLISGLKWGKNGDDKKLPNSSYPLSLHCDVLLIYQLLHRLTTDQLCIHFIDVHLCFSFELSFFRCHFMWLITDLLLRHFFLMLLLLTFVSIIFVFLNLSQNCYITLTDSFIIMPYARFQQHDSAKIVTTECVTKIKEAICLFLCQFWPLLIKCHL